MKKTTLKEYFKQAKEEHPHSHVQILGGGEFRKKGSQVKNWKIRSYYIKEDGMLLYFDPITKEPKGVIDVKEIAVTEGPLENLHTSGCSDFSLETGVSLVITIFSESRKMEVVFDTLKEAQRFCLLLGYVAIASNLIEFLHRMKWDDIATAIESRKDPSSHSSQRKLSVSSVDPVRNRALSQDEVKRLTEAFPGIVSVKSDADLTQNSDEERESELYVKQKPTIAELAAIERAREKESGFVIESSESDDDNDSRRESARNMKNATIIHSGFFYKQGQVRKNWKQRYFELWSTGVLLYKESKDSVVQRGRIDLKSSTISRIEVMMAPSEENKFSMKQSSGQQRVTALEMKQLGEKRVFLVTFDINSATRNASLLEQFEIALRRTSLDSTPLLTSSSSIIHDTSSSLSQRKISLAVPMKSPSKAVPPQSYTALSAKTGQRYSLKEGFGILFEILYQTFVKKKKFDQKYFKEIVIGIHQIVCDYISVFVKEHKDAVLLGGAPVFIYSLLTVCNRPSMVSILIFCCITSFFGVHYSSIPGLPAEDDDDDRDSKAEE